MNRPAHNNLAELYLHYGAVIFSRCRQLLKDDQLAEVATQEIFLRVRSKLQSCPTAQQALRWIYRALNSYLVERTWAHGTRAVSLSGSFVLPD